MKTILFFFPVMGILLGGCQSSETSSHTDQSIEKLLEQMTLEEKVGQMTQLNITAFMTDNKLDTTLVKKYLVDYSIGSVLNVPGNLPTVGQWRELVGYFQETALKNRLAIPLLYGIDAIHGLTYTKGATLYPHNINLAASRNSALVFQSAQRTARDLRAAGIRWNFDPVLDVGRQPLWARFEETYGEDTYLVSQLGAAAVEGYQGTGTIGAIQVAACMKHFLGYSGARSGKDRSPAYMGEAELHNTYLKPFIHVNKWNPLSVMLCSGSINGIPVHANKALITDLLKKEIKFKGLVVTDWLDIVYLHTQHKVAKDNREAVKMAVNAGIDMSMVPYDLSFYDDLVDLVKSGEVPMERIDDAVRRILTVKKALGLFEQPIEAEMVMPDEQRNRKLALEAARESIVLLKNGGDQVKTVLPLSGSKKVLLAGPIAYNKGALHGSWSYSWQGDEEALYPDNSQTLVDAFEHIFGKSRVSSFGSNVFEDEENTSIARLKQKARKADVIVLALGEKAYAETPGNIDDLRLDQKQIELAKAAYETGKPVVLILAEGRPRIIREIEAKAAAVIWAGRPGTMGAQAIAEVLNGEVNPSGKLPFSYPAHSGSVLTYDVPFRSFRDYRPQWAFGFGLNYGVYSIEDYQVKYHKEQSIVTVSGLIKNSSKWDVKAGIDLYVRQHYASIIPAQRKLIRFLKKKVKAGDAVVFNFEVAVSDLATFNSGEQMIVEPGAYDFMLGHSAIDITHQATIMIQ